MPWAKTVVTEEGLAFPTSTKRTLFQPVKMETEGLRCRVCKSLLPHGAKGEVFASVSRYKAKEIPAKKPNLGWNPSPVIPRLNEVRCKTCFENRYIG